MCNFVNSTHLLCVGFNGTNSGSLDQIVYTNILTGYTTTNYKSGLETDI